jgi:hypothetical protein
MLRGEDVRTLGNKEHMARDFENCAAGFVPSTQAENGLFPLARL